MSGDLTKRCSEVHPKWLTQCLETREHRGWHRFVNPVLQREHPEVDPLERNTFLVGDFAAADRSTILSEAEALVYGDRGKAYGHPSDDYARTAAIWTALLRHKLKDDLTAQDAILCMIGVKMSREVNLPGEDNRRDLAGYALCLDRVVTGK